MEGLQGVIKLKALSLVAIFTVILSTSQTATATTFNPSPLFTDVASYTTTSGVTDIYFPNPSDLKTGNYSFPVALLLQGMNVDKSNYSNYASTVARYGFVVVVPNNKRTLAPLGEGLFGETSQLDAVLAQMRAENSNPNSPVVGIVNTEKLGLLGHSFGGGVGLSAIGNLCLPRYCLTPFSLPTEVKAGAFYATGLARNPNFNLPVDFIPINNSIPIAIFKGTRDGVIPNFVTDGNYDNIQNPPKTLISLTGANHYGITNTNNPSGSVSDKNIPTIPQDVAIETLARWSGLFLRASILNDKEAFNYIYFTGDDADRNVSVVSTSAVSASVPESVPTIGLFGISIAGITNNWLRKRVKN